MLSCAKHLKSRIYISTSLFDITHLMKFQKLICTIGTSTIFRATKHSSCFIEASSGIAAVKHEPAIDPTVLLYLLESFNLKSKFSHCSAINIITKSFLNKHTHTLNERTKFFCLQDRYQNQIN